MNWRWSSPRYGSSPVRCSFTDTALQRAWRPGHLPRRWQAHGHADAERRLCRFFSPSDGYWLRAQASRDIVVPRAQLAAELKRVKPRQARWPDLPGAPQVPRLNATSLALCDDVFEGSDTDPLPVSWDSQASLAALSQVVVSGLNAEERRSGSRQDGQWDASTSISARRTG